MVDEPDRDKAVFVRVLRDVADTVYVSGTDVSVDMRRGDVWVIRWSAITEYALSGDVELI
jgi:GINS complex subunit 4